MTVTSSAGRAAAPAIARSKWLALTAMLFAVAMTFIDQTIVAIATPDIAQELSLTRTGSQWVVNAYLVALAAGFALGGRLADVVGSKRMVLLGIVGFAASSALCGATPTGSAATTWMIVFRALQGFSAAAMIPAALAVVVAAFPLAERGKALAIFFGVSGGLTAIGPIAGGFLTQWTWRAIFWINIPVALVAVVLALMSRLNNLGRRERIDVPGAVLVALGMGLSVLGLQQAASWGWADARTWACIAGGLVLLVAFVLFELRTAHPLIQVRIFRGRAFLVDNVVLFFSMIAFVPVFFFASVYSQVSLGYSANNAGLYLLTFFSGFAPAAQIAGRILDERGAKPALVIGGVLGTAGFALWAWRLTDLGLGSQWWAIVLAGAGIGFILGPSSTDAVNRALNASYGEVTGISQTVRNYGSALGLAVLGTLLTHVFTQRLTSTFVAAGVPADVAGPMAAQAAARGNESGAQSGGAGGAIGERIAAAVPMDFAVATRAVLIGMAVVLLVTLVAALAHPGGKAQADDAGVVPAGG
ncbi:MFS transporter [Nakamurella endophytica]|uniref:MFS transporter n=1 Tax=Nakamurella endophytica TaxID=1748367 RepID=A0A917STL2_9ACTN|nr:MFS transporter [Nakamurella endophytica]GGL95595.1 MFS transporter [Nakamurella endophytica]